MHTDMTLVISIFGLVITLVVHMVVLVSRAAKLTEKVETLSEAVNRIFDTIERKGFAICQIHTREIEHAKSNYQELRAEVACIKRKLLNKECLTSGGT